VKQKEVNEKVMNYEKDRKKKIDEMNEETKWIVCHSPLYKKIEKNFEEKILMPSLE
jgi:hypothetical protein